MGWRFRVDDWAHGLAGWRLLPRCVERRVCDWYERWLTDGH